MPDNAQSDLVTLCAAADVKPDLPVRAEVNGTAYAVFVVDGQYYVTQDQCTHGPGALSEGFVMGEEIECPFHQGRFNIKSGEPAAPPCTEALRTWTPEIVGGMICIKENAPRT